MEWNYDWWRDRDKVLDAKIETFERELAVTGGRVSPRLQARKTRLQSEVRQFLWLFKIRKRIYYSLHI